MSKTVQKVIGALCVTGVVAFSAGMIAHAMVQPDTLDKDAYVIEVAEVSASGSGAAKKKNEPEPITDILADADIAKGEKLAKVCKACHTFKPGGRNMVGPNLAGVVGRVPGSVEGFAYSDAMKNMGGEWDVETLNKFLWKPKKALPGTKMVFAGLRKAKDRAAMIKWMQEQK